MRPFVIGTAGHVDHGKSTLVKALTGIDPDRLAEEKARAMTIDLGFAWLTLPGGQSVSVVDVPGHERFIKNMLAGVGGIDAALLVVAADEGPMPQTVEHLAILDLLGVDRGVIVLTKVDAAEADWLDLVREEVRELVSTTTLADAPIVAVSALTGEGLPELLETLEEVLASAPGTSGGGVPRLPVDRVFSVAGFGTVVTGTLSGGEITTGDELRLYPGNRRARVRGLQSHQEKVARALPGRRTAVNLSGITTEEVQRGDVLAPPGIMSPSQRLDARLRLLPDASVALKQNDEVDFFTGAAELPARITLLDRERLDPGESAWVQFRFRAPTRGAEKRSLHRATPVAKRDARRRRDHRSQSAAAPTIPAGDHRGAGNAGRRRAGRDPPPGTRATTARDQGAHGRSRGTLRRAGRRGAGATHRGGRRRRARASRAGDREQPISRLPPRFSDRSPSRSARRCVATTPPSRCGRDWRGRKRGGGSASPSLVSSTT